MNVLYAVVRIQRYSSVEIFLRGPLYRAAMIRNHKPVLEASTKSKLPANPIQYHHSCRAEFTNKRDLQVANEPSDDAATGSAPRRSSRERNEVSSTILPDQCLFCKKSKCKPNTKTREKLQCPGTARQWDGKNMCFTSCATKHCYDRGSSACDWNMRKIPHFKWSKVPHFLLQKLCKNKLFQQQWRSNSE